ncbi:MAG: GGDEF domain-containing protein [Proteobacteria bacterium]|nr:GGDEF domain-containing protein [Pseudomonadota bacterium]
MIFHQIFEMVNVGIVILDKDMKVYQWNRWMEIHSGISGKKIIGNALFDHYPALNNKWFLRSCKSVFAFGNFSFFSQKLHQYCFPFKPVNTLNCKFKFMQQNCTLGPLRDENNAISYLYIMVQDVTEVAAYENKLVEMNSRDGLTGVYNRKFFETRLREEFERYKRYNTNFSLVMQDIDFFKKVNDNFGHLAGDYILKSFASTIISRIRGADIIARYGGEEFCCLLPETSIQSAQTLAEHIRKKIEGMAFDYEGIKIQITVSQGVAEPNTRMSTPDNILKLADSALYEAKKTGRNKVVTHIIGTSPEQASMPQSV